MQFKLSFYEFYYYVYAGADAAVTLLHLISG